MFPFLCIMQWWLWGGGEVVLICFFFLLFLFKNKKSHLRGLKPLANETSWFHGDCASVWMLVGLRILVLLVSKCSLPAIMIWLFPKLLYLLVLPTCWCWMICGCSHVLFGGFHDRKSSGPKALISWAIFLLNGSLEASLASVNLLFLRKPQTRKGIYCFFMY